MAKRLAIVLTEGYADWECGLLMATARGDCGAETVILTPGGADVTSLGGVSIKSAGRAEDAAPADFDVLVLCGGTIWQSGEAPDLSAPVARFVSGRKTGRRHLRCDAGAWPPRPARRPGAHRQTIAASCRTSCRPIAARRSTATSRRPSATAPSSPPRARPPVSFAREILDAIGLGSTELFDYLAMYGDEHRKAPA